LIPSLITFYIKGGRENGYPPFLTRKTLSKKLYTRNRIPPKAITATCWVLESAIRGTLIARVIAQNDRTPSVREELVEVGKSRAELIHTERGHYLSLQAKLLLEARRNIADASLSVTSDVRNFSNVVEHMATDEQKDGHERHSSPQVAALHDGIDISPEQYACSSDSNNGRDNRDPFNVVDGSLYFRVRSIRHVAGDPGVNYLSSCAPIFRTLVSIFAAL
jgi:hypothetical protein